MNYDITALQREVQSMTNLQKKMYVTRLVIKKSEATKRYDRQMITEVIRYVKSTF